MGGDELKKDVVASFSQDTSSFVFQTAAVQKNVLDIYPFSVSDTYKVSSSLVTHIDYDSNDLMVSDIQFLGWCRAMTDASNTTKAKRKHGDSGDEVAVQEKPAENFFVNVFTGGKVVVYSPNGKDVVNIIANKAEILQADTEESFIWILDETKTVKKYEYNQSKPLKTFHLTDGKDEEILHFQCLQLNGSSSYLACITKTSIYIIDPSKRRPSTVATFNIPDCKCCAISQDGEFLVIAESNKVSAANFSSKKQIQAWNIRSTKLGYMDGIIVSMNDDGTVTFHDIDQKEPLCTFRAENSKAIDFSPLEHIMIVAWLKVNEPRFEIVTLKDIQSKNEILVNQQQAIDADNKQPTKSEDTFDGSKTVKKSPKKKFTKAEQAEVFEALLDALKVDEENDEAILKHLTSPSWTEKRIKEFITEELNKANIYSKLLQAVLTEAQKSAWSDCDILFEWLKWLLIAKEKFQLHNKSLNKSIRELKLIFKQADSTLPVLIGIQGRIEMLKRQEQLRETLQQVNTTDDGAVETVDHVAAVDSDSVAVPIEAGDAVLQADDDAFFDASEYRN